jgi:hypothetical protein
MVGTGAYALFGIWEQSDSRRGVFEVERVRAFNLAIEDARAGRQVVVAGPVDSGSAVRFLLAGAPSARIRVADATQALIVPANRDSVTIYREPDRPIDADLWSRMPSGVSEILARNALGAVTLERLSIREATLPPPRHRAQVALGDVARILGVASPRRVDPGESITVDLTTEIARSDMRDLIWTTALLDTDEKVFAATNARPLAHATLRPGDQALIRQRLATAAAIPQGAYRVVLGVFDAQTGRRLSIGSESDRAVLGSVWVGKSVAAPASQPIRQWPGIGVALATADLTPIGSVSELRLAWIATAETDRDLTLYLHVRNREGQTVSQADAPPRRPTSTWVAGESILETRALPVAAGATTIAIGWYDAATGERIGVEGGNEMTIALVR